MPVDFDVVPASGDFSVAIDQVRRPYVAHELASVERFLLPHAVLLGHRMVFVGEQWKRDVELLREARLARFVENADTKHSRFRLLELRQVIAKVARLFSAARRVVLRIEIENDGPSGVIREPVGLPVLIVQGECRGFLSRFNQCHV